MYWLWFAASILSLLLVITHTRNKRRLKIRECIERRLAI